MSFWIVLGALRAVCVVLEGPGNTLEFRCILESPLGPQDPGNMELEGETLFFHPWGPATISIKTIPYCWFSRLQAYKQLPARINDTRLHDTRLQRASSAWWPLTSRGRRILSAAVMCKMVRFSNNGPTRA